MPLTPSDEFVVIASDGMLNSISKNSRKNPLSGVWDVMSNEQVVNFVRRKVEFFLNPCLTIQPYSVRGIKVVSERNCRAIGD